MKSTFRILFYVKRDKQKLDGTLPIMCRITKNNGWIQIDSFTNFKIKFK